MFELGVADFCNEEAFLDTWLYLLNLSVTVSVRGIVPREALALVHTMWFVKSHWLVGF